MKLKCMRKKTVTTGSGYTKMTVEDFESLQPGDIISHMISPWHTFIVVHQTLNGLKICQQGGLSQHSTINSGQEWMLISKVTKRKLCAKYKP